MDLVLFFLEAINKKKGRNASLSSCCYESQPKSIFKLEMCSETTSSKALLPVVAVSVRISRSMTANRTPISCHCHKECRCWGRTAGNRRARSYRALGRRMTHRMQQTQLSQLKRSRTTYHRVDRVPHLNQHKKRSSNPHLTGPSPKLLSRVRLNRKHLCFAREAVVATVTQRRATLHLRERERERVRVCVCACVFDRKKLDSGKEAH